MQDRKQVVIVIIIAVVVMALFVLFAVIIERRATEIGLLRSALESAELQITELQESSSGGTEVSPPPIPASDAEFRFPIAESDFMKLTSPYGLRVSPILNVEMQHQGLDIAAAWRAQVVSVGDGVVVEHWPPPDGYYRGHDVLGGLIVIEHENGWKSRYAHLSASFVNTGDRIQSGEVIGRVGNTGKSDGEHLHFELWDGLDHPVNPLLYLGVDEIPLPMVE
jgi:murein DD-endopeptidase MepM/ murein hydrolase activator NlpD